MEETTLFLFGVFVTLIVAGSIGVLLWAAVEDGRTEEAERQRRSKVAAEEESA